jgi:hypothetical protein
MRLITDRRIVAGLVATTILAIGLLLGLESGRRPVRAAGPAQTETVLRSMEAILRRQGLAAALDSLTLRAERDSSVIRDGHQMAHALGREAVAYHAGDATVIRECSPVFASGCYHGVVEASIHSAGHIDMPRLEQLCVGMHRTDRPGPGFECIHGLGHGILGAVGYDLEATLHYCDALSVASLAASCHSGAFMEAISSALGAPMPHTHADHQHGQATGPAAAPAPRRLTIDASDPYSPCDGFRDPYATSCWLFQGFVILRRTGFDAASALRICDGAPDGRAARCYESVGHQLTGLFQHDARWIVERCSAGAPNLAVQCAAGAALALDALDWSGNRAAGFCAAAPGAWKDACYRSAAGALTELASPGDRARLCASIERAYAAACRDAAALDSPPARDTLTPPAAGS